MSSFWRARSTPVRLALFPSARTSQDGLVLFLLAALLVILCAPHSQAADKQGWTQFQCDLAPDRAAISDDDDSFEVVRLPFGFPFQDDRVELLAIHTNGFVVLGRAGSSPISGVCGGCYAGQRFQFEGAGTIPDYTIAPWWIDWNPSARGKIYSGLVTDAGGGPERFVVEWRNVVPYGAAGGDAGDMPWSWGTTRVIGHVCDGPDMLTDPAAIFDAWFDWPPSAFSRTCDWNPYHASCP